MALSETVIIDKIEVLENSVLQIRQATVVCRDGCEIARTFRRYVLDPGMNPSLKAEDSRVQAVAAAVWTSDVIKARKTMIATTDAAVPVAPVVSGKVV